MISDDLIAADKEWSIWAATKIRHFLPPLFPKIVCLCGSTRFMEAFQKAKFDETLAGNIVLTIGCDTKSDGDLLKGPEGEEIKKRLDELHLRKVEIADEVLILNVGGYIGQSTHRELCHAIRLGKVVRFLEGCGAEIKKECP